MIGCCLSTFVFQVVISRLPVGHTHEDIDQKFSVISRVSATLCCVRPPVALTCILNALSSSSACVPQRLKGSDALTPQEFEEQVEGAFSDIKRDSNATVRMSRVLTHQINTCT